MGHIHTPPLEFNSWLIVQGRIQDFKRGGGRIREKGYTMKPTVYTLFMRSQTLDGKTNTNPEHGKEMYSCSGNVVVG